jgi:hypothetical protein
MGSERAVAEASTAETDLSITERLRGRPVTAEEAARSAQRLVNSHFRNPDSARISIPANPSDDDLIVTDFIRQIARSESQWVSVEDRLPPPHDPDCASLDVLVMTDRLYSPNMGIASVDYGSADDGPCWVLRGLGISGGVTHWMPLPAPPAITPESKESQRR